MHTVVELLHGLEEEQTTGFIRRPLRGTIVDGLSKQRSKGSWVLSLDLIIEAFDSVCVSHDAGGFEILKCRFGISPLH
jgi:hypothetical protein